MAVNSSRGHVKQPTVAKRTGWSTARPPERVRLQRRSTVSDHYLAIGSDYRTKVIWRRLVLKDIFN